MQLEFKHSNMKEVCVIGGLRVVGRWKGGDRGLLCERSH